VVAGSRRSDPEVQAGRALRRLRLARNWSQEEVAVRMTAYGYDFHQTMIAKIEAAQRPLRVRELADFAALYGVEVQDLVYPPTGSLGEIDQEIAEATAMRDMVHKHAAEARHQLDAAREVMHQAQKAYEVSAAEAAVLTGRLAALLAKRQDLAIWESGVDPLPESADKREGDLPKPTGASTASAAKGPTVLRILLGTRLRRIRESKQIRLEEAARVIRASGSKMIRLEAGRVGFKGGDVVDLLTFYGVTDGKEREDLMALAREANATGWWHNFSDILPGWFQAYVGLEAAATQARVYEVQFVPGLLQTEDYARAVMLLADDGVTAKDVERRVHLRMARQTVLDRPNPPDLRVVLDEAVLWRQVGGPAVIHDQVKHLIEMAERPNVMIRIIPFQASGGSVDGPFTILRFSEHDLPDVVYLEQLTSAMYIDESKDVNRYLKAMESLDAQALTSSGTTQFLRQLLKQPKSV
jgi:transcriptional regulator with XRE-family HTH domain